MGINPLLNPTPQPQYYQAPHPAPHQAPYQAPYQAPMQYGYGWLPATSTPATEQSVSPAAYRTPMNPPGFKGFASESNQPTNQPTEESNQPTEESSQPTEESNQLTEDELPRKRVKPNPDLPIRGKSTSTPKHGIPHESKYKHASGQSSTPRSQRPKHNLVVEFTDVAAHTAKCDQCNGRNKDGMTRCGTCGWQCCRRCLNTRHGDRTHSSFTSMHVPANEQGLSISNRRNTANVSVSASGSGSGSGSGSASVSNAATMMNTPCPVRKETINQTSPSVSSIVQSSNSPTPAERSGSTVSSAPTRRSGLAAVSSTPVARRSGSTAISSAPAQRSGVNTSRSTAIVQRSGFTAFSSIVTSSRPALPVPTCVPVSDRAPNTSRPSPAGATPEAKAAILLMDLSSDSSLSSTGVVEGPGSATQEHDGHGAHGGHDSGGGGGHGGHRGHREHGGSGGGGGVVMDNQDGVQWPADDFDFPVGEEYDNVRRNPSRRARPIDMKE
ncbi:hypothetical protein N7528_002319 [Penicillium herquei]|nr:hypothetical protein N7528_002319 [Penicillium herquei]